jgi:ATP-dependent DNA ligase
VTILKVKSPRIDGGPYADHTTCRRLRLEGRSFESVLGFLQTRRPDLGALLLGYHTDDGTLIYAGRVGTGMSEKVLKDLRRRRQIARLHCRDCILKGSHPRISRAAPPSDPEFAQRPEVVDP